MNLLILMMVSPFCELDPRTRNRVRCVTVQRLGLNMTGSGDREREVLSQLKGRKINHILIPPLSTTQSNSS